MKKFIITAFFPEVKPAHAAWQTATVTASNVAVATSRALWELRERPGVAGKHVSEIRLTIKETDVASSEQ
ncbi:MAG: hypothetical protein LAN84_00300 [Acidobacteriia bacterium]|nr:hypothetical protein [Terriglobia bacterium]